MLRDLNWKREVLIDQVIALLLKSDNLSEQTLN